MIRPAVVADAERIDQVESDADPGGWTPARVRSFLARPDASCLVTEPPLAAAHLLGTRVLDEAEVVSIAVAREARRQGLGQRVLEAALARWNADGVRTVFLEVKAHNVAARALYVKCGFTEYGTRSGYYRDGSDAALYQARLGEPPPLND